MKIFKFFVNHSGEIEAGILPYTEEIYIVVESGNLGENNDEFIEHMKESLESWYDGATIKLEAKNDM